MKNQSLFDLSEYEVEFVEPPFKMDAVYGEPAAPEWALSEADALNHEYEMALGLVEFAPVVVETPVAVKKAVKPAAPVARERRIKWTALAAAVMVIAAGLVYYL